MWRTTRSVGLTSHPDQVPQALAASIRLVRAVPERLIIITIRSLPVPTVTSGTRLKVTPAGQMGRIRELIFAFLHRNAARLAQFFGIPDGQIVTLSTYIDL